MKILLKFLIFSLIVVSCQNSVIREGKKIKTFNLKKLPETTSVKLSDLGFEDIEYIPLETNEQSPISGTFNLGSFGTRLIAGDDFFIIKHFNTILKFRNDGSFVTSIGTVGRGPDEFLVAHDVEIDDKGNLYIVDGWEKKIFIYSENGGFIKTIAFTLYGAVEYRFVDGMFLCYNQNNMGNVENSFNFIDTSGKIIKSFPNRYPFVVKQKDAYGFQHENLFYRFNNRLFKKEVYSDTIFVYGNMDFKPHLVIAVGDKLITTQARSEIPGLDLAKNYISSRNLFEFGDYIYYEFTYKFDFSNTEVYSFIGSKKNDFQALINPEDGLINDLDGGPNILPQTIKDDNTLIAWIDALELKTHVASEAFKNSKPKYPEKKIELEKLANSLKETDNPVLMIVELKK